MGSRDHSYECEVCGFARGGMNDLLCACEMVDEKRAEALFTLAHNLAIGAALCRAHSLGNFEFGFNWWPGCDRSAP